MAWTTVRRTASAVAARDPGDRHTAATSPRVEKPTVHSGYPDFHRVNPRGIQTEQNTP